MSTIERCPVAGVAGGEQGVSNAASTRLTAAEFQGLADVPPEAEWFANIDNLQTRRAYRNDLREFMAFVGISAAGEFRVVTRSHTIAWRKDLGVGSSPGRPCGASWQRCRRCSRSYVCQCGADQSRERSQAATGREL